MSGAFDGVVGAGIGAVGSLFSSLFQNNSNKKEARRNRDFAHNEAILAHERQLEIMDKQNAWNTPENQRQLLTSAGYNPNALLSQGATSVSTGASGGAQAAQPSSFASAAPVDLGGMASLIGAIADAKLKEKQGNKIDSETLGQDLQNAFDEVRNQLQLKYGDKKELAGLTLMQSQAAVNDAEVLLKKSQADLNADELVNLRPKQAANIVADTLLKNSQSDLNRILAIKNVQEMELELKRYILQLKVAASTIALNYANARNADANAAFTNRQTELWQDGGILHTLATKNAIKSEYEGANQMLTYDIRNGNYEAFYDQVTNAFALYLGRVNTLNSVWEVLEPFVHNQIVNIDPTHPVTPY